MRTIVGLAIHRSQVRRERPGSLRLSSAAPMQTVVFEIGLQPVVYQKQSRPIPAGELPL
jgi:hypothetical protein